MKLVITMISLLGLTSCTKSESTKSKKCTYNDQPIDCSLLEGSRSDSASTEPELSLNAEVTTEIRILDNAIEALSHTHNFERETHKGLSYECTAFTNASDLYYFKVKGNKLQIGRSAPFETLERVSGNDGELYGTWMNEKKVTNGKRIQTVIITEESMTLKAKCIFE